jgi:formylglycine-generating enzyme required for sulfatase activity
VKVRDTKEASDQILLSLSASFGRRACAIVNTMSTPPAGTTDSTIRADKPPRHVFVSFASEDIELARHAVRRLEAAGLRCWISERDIEAAASYPAAITSAVAGSGALLLLLTEAANASPHVLREIELAFNARVHILPVRIAGVLPSADLQYFLSTTQWLDAGADFDEPDVQKVEARLRALLQSSGAAHGGGTGEPYRWRVIASLVGLLAVGVVVAWWLSSDGRVVTENTEEPTPRAPSAQQEPATASTSSKVNPRDGQTYIWLPPGRFVMGCSPNDPACDGDEKPPHSVDLNTGFWLARTEVTRGQYTRLVGGAKSAIDEDLPVTGISWASAKAYCAAAGGRLPSEAEWEYAARAGTTTRYYGTLPAIAWFADNADGQPQRVAAKMPNAFGLHDMLGNVSEWARDRYYNAYDDSADPTIVEEPLAGNASGVARGGSWLSDEDGVRVSRRLEMLPDAEEPHIGFRCVIDRL